MSISIIIPTLYEEDTIAETIQRTRQLGDCEIIVADGGSTDATFDRAAAADQRVIARRGRAYQLNKGAEVAAHNTLLFLHSDCQLSPTSLTEIAQYLGDETRVGGCFRLQIDHPAWKYRIAEKCIAARVRLLKWGYGDQGLFVKRDVFERVGRFPEFGLMEDLYFVKRLKRAGGFSMLPQPIRTSARRWEKHGLLRQTLRNWTLIGLAHLGVSPNRLAAYYRANKG